MVAVWRRYDSCAAAVWQLCGGCVAVVWRLCGGCVAAVWRLCGGCVVAVRRLCGGCVAAVPVTSDPWPIRSARGQLKLWRWTQVNRRCVIYRIDRLVKPCHPGHALHTWTTIYANRKRQAASRHRRQHRCPRSPRELHRPSRNCEQQHRRKRRARVAVASAERLCHRNNSHVEMRSPCAGGRHIVAQEIDRRRRTDECRWMVCCTAADFVTDSAPKK